MSQTAYAIKPPGFAEGEVSLGTEYVLLLGWLGRGTYFEALTWDFVSETREPNMRKCGHVFDAYDDTDGQILRSIVSSQDGLPDFVKTASRLTSDQIDSLPDDNFALVLVDQGYKMKKFATIDAGNTALSVMYLLKRAHLLPPAAVKIAAHNLIVACSQYGLDVPPHLEMAEKTGMSPISGKSNMSYIRAKGGMNIRLGEHDAANADVEERTNMNGVPGTNFLELPASPKETIKEAFMMRKTAAPEGVEVRVKEKSWRESPYLDVSQWDPSSATATEVTQPERTLLAGKYPIDGYDQVKTASAYFRENLHEFHARHRHEYCVKLASRMEELGIGVPEDVEKYGSTTYAADIDSRLASRRSCVSEEFSPVLDLLMEKRAHVSPDTFVEALEEFDVLSGLRPHWGSLVSDPWYTTFGKSFEKIAEEEWRYDGEDGTRVSEEDLENLANNGNELVTKTFGPDFAKEFQKKPKTVFTSLPTPNKKILARMAQDRYSGTGTE